MEGVLHMDFNLDQERVTRSLSPSSTYRPLPPGPKGHFYVGSLPERRKDPLGFFSQVTRDYGDIAYLKFGPRRGALLSHPDFSKHVLVDNHKNYIKGFGYDKLEAILGKGLLTSEGEFWRKQRRLAQPAFHRTRLATLFHHITDATTALLQRWESYALRGDAFDLHLEMNQLTLRIVSQMLLGTDISSEEASHVGLALKELLETANNRILSLFPLPLGVPTPSNLRSRENSRTLDAVVYRIIEEHRRANERGIKTNDLLTMLMEMRDEDTGEGMSDRQLRDEVMTMFLAGHETTANLLTWTFYHLSKNPAVDRRLLQEVREKLSGRAPDFDSVSELTYTDMVLHESLRLSPPAWIFSREAVSDDIIGQYRIPEKTIVLISPYVMHRKKEYWDNPEGYDPDRFLEEQNATRPKHVFIPFGGGPRQCIGNHFALLEAQAVLSMIVQKYHVQLVAGCVVDPEPLITLRPRGGMKVIVKKR